MTSPATAVVLFAHGSRDPLWRGPIDAVAQEILRQSPQATVRCAFLELMSPSLAEAVDAGRVQVQGELARVQELLGLMERPGGMFPMVEPRPGT